MANAEANPPAYSVDAPTVDLARDTAFDDDLNDDAGYTPLASAPSSIATALGLALDHLQKLSSNPGSREFHRWRRTWTIAFRALEIYEVLESDAVTSETQQCQVHLILMMAVNKELVGTVAEFSSPMRAWQSLNRKYGTP